MSVAVASGYPQYADASIAYIPKLYAKLMVPKYYAASVLTAISNTKYEGVIRDQGDEVIIRTRPTITIFSYTKGQTLNPQTPSSPPVKLLIDQGKAYDFVIDVVDEKQADIVLSDEFLADSAEQMKIAVDTDVLGYVYTEAAAANKGATAGAISGAYNLGTTGSALAIDSTNALNVLTRVSSVFDEQNVPESDRCIVIPTWYRYLLLNGDLKNASLTGDDKSPVRNGRLGEVDRLTIYTSNLLSTTVDGGATCYNAFACHKDALTFAAQLVRNESLPATRTFGREYRGLHVYGRKVVKPEALVHLYIRKA